MITKSDLNQVEKFADRLFAKVGIDVEFTRHFMDRVNDARNQKDITPSELTRLFKQSYSKYGKRIAQLGPDAEAVESLLEMGFDRIIFALPSAEPDVVLPMLESYAAIAHKFNV